MNVDLKGQVSIVTGASRGLGLAMAKELARAGSDVHLIATQAEIVASISQKISQEFGVKCQGWELDLAKSENIQPIFDSILKFSGKVDILVNNAGVTRDNLILRMSEADIDTVLDVNLKGAMLCAKAVGRPMIKHKHGRILNLSSIVGIKGQAGQANYSASKAGLIGFTKSLARELGNRNVTCNAIAPGFIESDMTAGLSHDLKASILSQIPAGRFGSPQEVAYLGVFLVSPQASYINGQVFGIDGGMGA